MGNGGVGVDLPANGAGRQIDTREPVRGEALPVSGDHKCEPALVDHGATLTDGASQWKTVHKFQVVPDLTSPIRTALPVLEEL